MKFPIFLLMFLCACDGVLSPNNSVPKITTDCSGITACTDDGCCPSECDDSNDVDCSASCGDGVVDAMETCDGNCPTSCDDGNSCNAMVLEGSAANCTSECVTSAITACEGGDGCCASGCDSSNDSDCAGACDQVGICQHSDGCCPDGCTPMTDDDCQIDCADAGSWPGDWGMFESQVISEINQARAAGANCGQYGQYDPTGPVSMDDSLQQAARCHSNDMASNNIFDHVGSDGSSFSQRTDRAGFSGQPLNENIAVGQQAPAGVVTSWLGSDGHCRNLMNPDVNVMGIGYVNRPGSEWTRYWTMVGGRN